MLYAVRLCSLAASANDCVLSLASLARIPLAGEATKRDQAVEVLHGTIR